LAWLALVKRTDAIGCAMQRVAQIWGHGAVGCLDWPHAESELCEPDAIDPSRVISEGGVALAAYVCHDLGHSLLGRHFPVECGP
jgi:hypothetical protein